MGAPDHDVELHTTILSSRRRFGAPNDELELQTTIFVVLDCAWRAHVSMFAAAKGVCCSLLHNCKRNRAPVRNVPTSHMISPDSLTLIRNPALQTKTNLRTQPRLYERKPDSTTGPHCFYERTPRFYESTLTQKTIRRHVSMNRKDHSMNRKDHS